MQIQLGLLALSGFFGGSAVPWGAESCTSEMLAWDGYVPTEIADSCTSEMWGQDYEPTEFGEDDLEI